MMRMIFLWRLPVRRGIGVLGILAALGGCGVDAKPAFHDVNALVREHTGHGVAWNQGTEEDRQAAEVTHQLLSHELTDEKAVEIALLNNPGLQATFEEIGIAQADLVQAGLLRNPEFSASWRFPDQGPHQTDAEYSISEDFLDLLVIPLRKKFVAAELERRKRLVADAVVALVAQVKEACYRVQGQEQLLGRLKLIVEVNQSAAELAARQLQAGTMNDLDVANQEALFAQSKLDVTQAQIELTADRERLNRLMGVSGADTAWKTAPQLPAIPETDLPLDDIESLAIRERLDLAAKRQAVEALGKALGLTEDFRYLGTLKLGVDTEHNPDGQDVTGPTLDLEVPIFDQGQARIAKIQSQYRQARRELLQMAVAVGSEVREARDRMMAERELARFYGQTLLPQRIKIVNLTQLHYNGMLKGTYDLLLAKENEVATERAYVSAWRDYWIARAELERALGGKLPAPIAAPTSQVGPVPATQNSGVNRPMQMNGDKP